MIRAILLASLLALPRVAICSERPNVLVILADDMGYGDLSCYGSLQIDTPNIDALAERGIRCTQSYVAMMVCAPSRAGLMTGKYPNRFGFEQNLVDRGASYRPDLIGLDLDQVTIADVLRSAGYATACIGKWHLGSDEAHHPNSRGFDYYFGRYKGHGYFPKATDRQMYRQRAPVEQIDVPYTTDWYTKESIDFIRRVGDERPWFLYLAHDTPHTPLQAKKEDLQKFAHISNRQRRVYCAMQHCLDENVGRLLEHLRETDQLDNTLIVFLSDNGGTTGGSINAPLRGCKATFLEGGIRVPMILSWPDRLPQGVDYQQPIIALDLLPTFAAAAGATVPSRVDLDGVDLLPHLEGGVAERPHDDLFFRMILRGAAYRRGDWKLIRLPHAPPALYDLSADISELNDLASARPDMVREMLVRLNEWEQTHEATPRWISSNRWIGRNRPKYNKKYQLAQPQ